MINILGFKYIIFKSLILIELVCCIFYFNNSKLIKRSIEKSKIHLIYGISYYKNKWYLKAINELTESIFLNENNSISYFYRGMCYYHKRHYDTKIKDYKRTDHERNETKDYKRSIVDYNKSIEINPNNAEVYFSRGLAYERINKSELAIKDYSNAIKLNPNNCEYYNKRGNIYIFKRLFSKAIHDFSNAIKLNPKNNHYYYWRGLSYAGICKKDNCINDFDIIIKREKKSNLANLCRKLIPQIKNILKKRCK